MAYFAKLAPALLAQLEHTIQGMLPAQVEALQALVQIPSVKAPADGACPFGSKIQAALDYTLALARVQGLSTKDIDGYVGTAVYGQGEQTLGVLTHLDVVPAGNGWSVPPFSGAIKDGMLYGRGTTDNKGPALSALFALAAIRRCEIPLPKKVQLLFGCDEESNWACMERFIKTERLPDIAFSPDASYPLVHCERTIVHAAYCVDAKGTGLRVQAGARANVVPGVAMAVLPVDIHEQRLPDGFAMQLTKADGATTLRVQGKDAHAATPKSGRNALQMLLALLAHLPLAGVDASIISALHTAFGMDMHGEGLGLDCEDESGRLTLNPGVLQWDAHGIRLEIDARCPRSLAGETLIARVGEALAPAGFVCTKQTIQPGHFIPLESELVTRLMGVYQAQTGDMTSRPLAIGGGTYARAMPYAVAFGCEFVDDTPLAHMPDERIQTERIAQNTHMLADAILSLAL